MKRRDALKSLLGGMGIALIPAPVKALIPATSEPVTISHSVYGQLAMGAPAKQYLIVAPGTAASAARRAGKTAAMWEAISSRYVVVEEPTCPRDRAYLVDMSHYEEIVRLREEIERKTGELSAPWRLVAKDEADDA